MKRLGLTLVAALCLAATTFAAGNQIAQCNLRKLEIDEKNAHK